MKNKNLLKALAALTLGSAAAFGLTMAGCNNHDHTYSDKWSTSETHHWHAATCEDLKEGDNDYMKDYGEHVDSDDNGICDVCEYVIEEKGEPDGPENPVTQYTVTFNVNGHGTAPAAQKVDKDGKATAPTAPTADGWTFGGWYTDNNTFANEYNFNTSVTADITLYAKWTENTVTPPPEENETYTVTFVLNGHGTAIEAVEVEENGTVTAPTAPTADGWTFGGWYTDNETFANEYNFNTAVTADITLYAKWTENTVTPPVEDNSEIELDTEKTFESAGYEQIEFTFEAPAAGNYTVTVTENSFISVYTKEAWDGYGDPFVDGNETNTGVIQLSAGEKVTLVLACADSGTYSITITEGGEVEEPELQTIVVGVSAFVEVPLGDGFEGLINIEEAGVYTVTVQPAQGISALPEITVQIGDTFTKVRLNSNNNYTADINIVESGELEILVWHITDDNFALYLTIAEKDDSGEDEEDGAKIINISDLSEATTTLAEGVTTTSTLTLESKSFTSYYNGEEITFTKTLKTSGQAKVDANSIKFENLKAGTTIVVYAISGSTGTERFLALYDSTGSAVADTTQSIGDANFVGTAVFNITDDGTYYIGSNSGGIAFCYIAILEDAIDEVKTTRKIDAVAPGCETVGNIEYYVGSYGRLYKADGTLTTISAVKVAATGHDYTNATYTVTKIPPVTPEADEEATGIAQIKCVNNECEYAYEAVLPELTSTKYTQTAIENDEENCTYSYTDPYTKVVVEFVAKKVDPVHVVLEPQSYSADTEKNNTEYAFGVDGALFTVSNYLDTKAIPIAQDYSQATSEDGKTFTNAFYPSETTAAAKYIEVKAKEDITLTVYFTITDSNFSAKDQTKGGTLAWTINGGDAQSNSNTANKSNKTAYMQTITLSAGDTLRLYSTSNRLAIFELYAAVVEE